MGGLKPGLKRCPKENMDVNLHFFWKQHKFDKTTLIYYSTYLWNLLQSLFCKIKKNKKKIKKSKKIR